MTQIDGGATLWARKTLESEIFKNKPDKWFKIWFYIVNKIKFKTNGVDTRGSAFIKYEWIEENCTATQSEVDHCIRFLKSATQIATRKATRGMIITVLNYEIYQNINSYKSDTKSDIIGEVKAKQKRNKSDTILKNGNKDIKVKESISLQSEDCQKKSNSINKLLGLFKEVNPSYEKLYPSISQRKCLEFLINKFTEEKIEKLILSLKDNIYKPYAPKITTPYQLQQDLGKYLAFLKQEKEKGSKFAVSDFTV